MFKITVERIEEEEIPFRPEHTIIGEELADEAEMLSKYEVARLNSSSNGGIHFHMPVKKVYGYTPPPPPGTLPARKEVKRAVFEQTVDTLDLAVVIAAVNGLTAP